MIHLSNPQSQMICWAHYKFLVQESLGMAHPGQWTWPSLHQQSENHPLLQPTLTLLETHQGTALFHSIQAFLYNYRIQKGCKLKLAKYLKTKTNNEKILSTISGFILLRFQIPWLSMTFPMASPNFPHLNLTFLLLKISFYFWYIWTICFKKTPIYFVSL